MTVGYETIHWTNLLNVFVPLSRIVESLKLRVFSGIFFYHYKDFLQISSVKWYNILCAGKFDRHNFIRREKRGVNELVFP